MPPWHTRPEPRYILPVSTDENAQRMGDPRGNFGAELTELSGRSCGRGTGRHLGEQCHGRRGQPRLRVDQLDLRTKPP